MASLLSGVVDDCPGASNVSQYITFFYFVVAALISTGFGNITGTTNRGCRLRGCNLVANVKRGVQCQCNDPSNSSRAFSLESADGFYQLHCPLRF